MCRRRYERTALKTKNIWQNRFSIWRIEFLNTMQCGTIRTFISPGDCTLQCSMWLWHRDSEFMVTKWQHTAMWYVALGWHAIEFAQTSAILEFYIWFRPHHRSRHVILHQSPKLYPNRTTLGRKKWRHGPRRQISAILDFRDPIMGSLTSPCTTSYRSSIDTIALNCLVFEKIALA